MRPGIDSTNMNLNKSRPGKSFSLGKFGALPYLQSSLFYLGKGVRTVLEKMI
jgi:hypothetical protein